MPELPELEVIREVLNRRVAGLAITDVKVIPPGGPIVVRDLTYQGFEVSLTGTVIAGITRRGKFLVFSFDRSEFFLAINPKLTGRLQLAFPSEKRLARTYVIFTLANGGQLRYNDQKKMGQLYLTPKLELVPEYAGLGPEPFDVTPDQFEARLKHFTGEIKGILTRGECIAGIGNAYADEILWAARIHPYRKRSQLSPEEIGRLYSAIQATLAGAIEKIRMEMGENIHLEPRDFMNIHMKAGQPCPRCGNPIALISANQRITNFCRTCQPGGLIKGMDHENRPLSE